MTEKKTIIQISEQSFMMIYGLIRDAMLELHRDPSVAESAVADGVFAETFDAYRQLCDELSLPLDDIIAAVATPGEIAVVRAMLKEEAA